MATSRSDVVKENVTLKKDIQISDFANLNAVSNAAIFFYNDAKPFCKVSVNPVCRSNPDFVSVRVKRCSFYPRFYHGVVYKSLGWMVSVVDAEGAEKFVSYFGYDDFQRMNWEKYFFSERGYELQEFVKRSVLLDDPERFLPEGVLTVRVEMFYECRVGGYETVILETCKDIKVYNNAAFYYLKKEIDVQLYSNLMECEYVSLEEKKKEIILMMEETFQEVKEAMELYANYQRLEHIAESSYEFIIRSRKDFCCPDFMKDMDLFQRLFAKVGFEPPIVWDIDSPMVKPLWFYEKYQQLLRIFAIYKHLVHWTNRKKTAAQNRPVQISEDDGMHTFKCLFSTGIRALFFSYKETVKESQPEAAPDHLFICVSHFLNVFLFVIRIMCFRLFSILEQDLRSRIAVYKEGVNEVDKLENTSPSCTSTNPEIKGDSIGVAYSMDKTDLGPRTMDKTDLGPRTMDKTDLGPRTMDKTDLGPRTMDKTDLGPWTMDDTDLETSGDNEPWYFTIETSDNEQIKIPFQTGTTTLGSLLRSASPVFDRMLETPMAEQSNRFLKINDFDYLTFSRFLVFLQEGTVHALTVDDCMKLYQFAHKYQAEELCLRCVKNIEEILAFDFSEAGKVQEFSLFYQEYRLLEMVHFSMFDTLYKMGLWTIPGGIFENNDMSSEPTWAKHSMNADTPTDGKYDFYQ